jgi:hypothetical protein
LWKKAINQFSDMTSAEFANSHGWVSPHSLERTSDADGKLSNERTFLDSESHLNIPADFKISDLPTSVDWRTKNVVTPIKNQGSN